MKIIKKLLIPSLASLAILIAGNSQAMEKPNKPNYNYWEYKKQFTEEALIANNQVDATTKEILDKDWDKQTELNLQQLPKHVRAMVLECWGCLARTTVLEEHGLILKNGVSRIIGSQLINKCAAENNLAVRAPVKKCYMRDDLVHIIVSKIKPSDRPFSLKQIRDLYKIAKLTGLQDMHAGNIFNTQEGEVVIVDTEHRSFLNYWFGLPHNPLLSLVPGLVTLTTVPMEPTAKEWLSKKIERITEKEMLKATDYAAPVALIALDTCIVS